MREVDEGGECAPKGSNIGTLVAKQEKKHIYMAFFPRRNT